MSALLPRFHPLAVLVPEIAGEFARAGIEQLRVLQHLVVEIVLGGDAECARLDPHVDVLRHQDHVALRMGLRQMHHNGDDLVVCLASGQRGRQHRRNVLGLQEQPPCRRAVRFGRQRNPLGDAFAGVAQCGHQFVEETAHLAGIARHFGHALLVVVEFLEREDGQVDVVFLEPEQARRVMHQNVRVEDEEFRRGRRAGLGGLAGGEEVQRGRGGAQLAFDHGPPTGRVVNRICRTYAALYAALDTSPSGRHPTGWRAVVVERGQCPAVPGFNYMREKRSQRCSLMRGIHPLPQGSCSTFEKSCTSDARSEKRRANRSRALAASDSRSLLVGRRRRRANSAQEFHNRLK